MAVGIQSFRRIVPMIYAYTTPGVSYHEGWTKVGYTESQTVEQRIKQQTHTAGIQWKLAWKDNALYKDGSGKSFTDHAFHAYLESNGVKREKGTEWFEREAHLLRADFDAFASHKFPVYEERCDYTLRQEQQEAVRITAEYFKKGGREFLWNAKPRFGKTLSSYALIQALGFEKVLIVTNRPSIAASWAEDFFKFIAWRGKLTFVSETETLKNTKGVLRYQEYCDAINANAEEARGIVAFESLQGLKTSIYFGNSENAVSKLEWMAKSYTDGRGKKNQGLHFDLLIVDESHEGVDTMRTERVFDNIARDHTLYLSGTPFKALAGGQFSAEQIYNWSYADEQAAKAAWTGEEFNPYEALPRLALFTYRLSDMIYEKAAQGIQLEDDDGGTDYAFDLNEFFAVNDSGNFVHEKEVKQFLHALVTNEKYPYSTPELRRELGHTLWLLNRVNSAKALANLLKRDPVFSNYEIILAAGDGKTGEDEEESDELNQVALKRVRAAIVTHDKTITLSVGQLTVGVTVPEWSGILMLCNLKSPAAYMQAAFRVQNPCTIKAGKNLFRKETAYVFDFDPARTLIIFDEFANNLSPMTANGAGTGEERKENIRTLLNFFPVLGEDSEGRMVELDAEAVLSIPRRLKSEEVVRHGFMSNFLFQNISNIFGAPGAATEILEKLIPAKEDPKRRDHENLQSVGEVPVNEAGEVEIPEEIVIGKAQGLFGEKRFARQSEELTAGFSEDLRAVDAMAVAGEVAPKEAVQRAVTSTATALTEQLKQAVIAPLATEYGLKKSAARSLEREVTETVQRKAERMQGDYAQALAIAAAARDEALQTAVSEADTQHAQVIYRESEERARRNLEDGVVALVYDTMEQQPVELVRRAEEKKAEQQKENVEDSVRAHLRGFARTIPSFIMAYGTEKLCLKNFEKDIEPEVFREVTGITRDEFRFLRDGGTYLDKESGEEKHFAGQLFDETVFDDSIRAFLEKRRALANYFDETQTEDIFDYIPPQRTNQIFTPRRVVVQMVDELEKNNPGCFDNPEYTFADLYMKSGLYITELVKRLFRSEKMKELFPDEKQRIRHILEHQLYGMAPSRIIYLIATNYIFGFDESLRSSTKHFVEADAALAAKEGTLATLVEKHFG